MGAFALVAAGVLVVSTPARQEQGPSVSDRIDLAESIGRFVQDQPQDSGYQAPTQHERGVVADGVRAVLGGHPAEAPDLLSPVGYSLRQVVDTGTGRPLYELSDTSGSRRGWGRVLVDTDPAARTGIEVPHPKADLDSELLGVGLFRKVPGSVLVVAGAHRRAAPNRRADMAHATDSVFEAVHEVLAAQGVPVVQLHGYANDSAPDNDMVVSSGPTLHGPLADRVANALEAAGYAVCRPWVTRCPGLEATTNAQAQWSAAHGDEFVHVEVARENRDSPQDRDRVVAALAQELNGR
ncbi:hypothetical protein GCM10010174_13340 [Kutzneria viridogrisea]|uniref:Secreted protein n=1 Tax=Kutzneria viridogrisea TaxID=47990 RepID=A0ABR6BI31_9PSEU|nr:hypothetical protein [Kutzneria viridogrisea]